MGIIDLTQPIISGMPVYEGDPAVSMNSFLDYQNDGCRVSHWQMGSHTGTHVDVPNHFFPNGKTLDQYPLNRFLGRGIKVNLTGLEREASIEPIHLKNSLHSSKSGDFIILHTGWDSWWNQPEYNNHPYLTLAAVEALIQGQISLVAIDAPDVDKASGNEYPVHLRLLEQDILIVENLCRLNQVASEIGQYGFFPLPLHGADASPVRAFYGPGFEK